MQQSTTVSLSVLSKPNGILTKKLNLVNGFVESDSSECRMSSGLAEKINVRLEDLPNLFGKLSSNQCITTGWVNTTAPQVELLARDKFKSKAYSYPAQTLPHGTYATRTLDSFVQDGYSLVMFDFDDDSSSPFKIDSPDVFIDSLATVIPDFNRISFVRSYSSSSAVFDVQTGAVLKPASGFHIWMAVKDGTDLQRFGQVLEKRLWLAGFGYIKISKRNANLLTRTIVDTAVFSPERLCFEAGAVVTDDRIVQRLPAPEWNARELQVLDTHTLLDLSDQEERNYHTQILNEKLSDKIVRQKADIKQNLANELVAMAQAAGKLVPHSQAMRMVDNLEKHILPPFHTIYFEDGSQASVLEIVSNPALFNNKECLDPLREDKGFGRAKVFGNLDQATPRPTIHSFVEGERNFDLLQSMALLTVKSEVEQYDELRELVTTYENQDQEYFNPIELKPGITLIKGEKGTGKTVTVSEMIQETNLSVLGVTPRIGLTQTMAKDFKLACYNEDDMKDTHVMRSQRRLAICYDSLPKLAGQYFDIIVADEIIQTMRHVKSSSVKHKFICLNVLRSLILNAKYVIMMDADISADYLQLLKDPELGCCRASVDINLVYNHYKPAKEQKRKIYNYTEGETSEDEIAWGISLLDYTKLNGTFIATNSRDNCYNLANEILENWGLDVITEKGHFITEYEGRRVITITSDNSSLKEVATFVKDINKNLRPDDVFIASPSLGTGVSIKVLEDGQSLFERVYFRFTKRAGNTSADCAQHIARVRGCKEYHGIVIDTMRMDETDPAMIIDREVYGRVRAVDRNVHNKDLNFDVMQNKYVFADGNWSQWFGRMTSFENIDRNEFRVSFFNRMLDEGYTVEDTVVYLTDSERADKKSLTKRIREDQKDREVELVIESPLVTDEEKVELEKKMMHTVEEKRLLLKRHTADRFGQYNEDALSELLTLSPGALKNRSMGLYFGMNTESLFLTDLSNRIDSDKMHIEKTTHYVKQKLMLQVAAAVGVTIDEDGLPVSDGAPILDGMKAKVYHFLKANEEDAKALLSISVKRHDTILGMATVLGNALKAMGLKTARKNYKVKKKVIKVPYICEDSLKKLREDILMARENSPERLFKPLDEVPNALGNYVAQRKAGMPQKANREHRYISQLKKTESDLLTTYVTKANVTESYEDE